MSMRDPELVNPLTEPSGELKPSETSETSAPSGSSVPGPDSVPVVSVVSELMLLPDGRILAHHLTPELASFLRTLLDPKASTPEPESTTP
jgi:hypothetical protein